MYRYGNKYTSIEKCYDTECTDSYEIKLYFQKLTLGNILSYMLDLSKAVQHLHMNKVMHRDIKPENVLMVQQGDQFICKLCDFSISRLLTDSNFAETVCGTFIFVAPEVLERPRYTFSVDVFSLGLVFFVMKTRSIKRIDGRKALVPYVNYKGKDKPLVNCLRGKVDEDEFIEEFFEDIPELGELIYRMLDIEPERRPNMESVVPEIAEIKGSILVSQHL